MATPARPFRPLAVSLTRKTLWLSFACATLVCLLQAAYSYQMIRERHARVIDDIAATHVPLLAINVWDIEPAAVAQQVRAIAERSEVGYVWVDTKTGQRFTGGDAHLLGKARVLAFNIPYPRAETGSVGSLHIVANPRAMLTELWQFLLPTLVGHVVLSVLLCLFVAGLLRRDLQWPMQGIAEFVTRLTPQSLTRPLRLRRVWQPYRDEIDLVADGFRTLQGGISTHIDNLDQLVAERTRELEEALRSLQRIAMTDPLTDCFNRRHFDERFPMEVERAQRYGRPLSVMFCDVDHFKQINDHYGHAFGDQVLRGIAGHFQHDLRGEVDWVGRYGGEEFVIVLPETELAAACATAERLRRRVAEARFVDGARRVAMTVSFGVAQWRPGELPDALLARADALLLLAKQGGRNQVLPPAPPDDPLARPDPRLSRLIEGLKRDR